MDETLIDDDTLSLARKSVLPGAGFFVLDEYRDDVADAEVKNVLEDAQVAVLTDSDADGFACAAIIRAVHPEAVVIPSGPNDLIDDLERVARFAPASMTLFVCDLVPDAPQPAVQTLHQLADLDIQIHWYDHHQWPSDVETAITDAGVELVVGDDAHECTADVAVRAIDAPVPPRLVELAEVTRDHDLWIKADPRSDDLADYSFWAESAEYIETVLAHGPDLPDSVKSFLEEQREEKHALIDLAVNRAEFHTIGTVTVAATYGRCSQNEVADELRERGADAAIIVKPAGSVSLRGSDSFARCHEVARVVGGGGHPKAAGCKPPIYEDMLDYAYHWVTEGAITKRTLLEAFDRIISDDNAE